MKSIIQFPVLVALALSSSVLEGRQVGTTIVTHVLEIAEPGNQTKIVSVPFLKVPSAHGRLDGAHEGALRDEEGAFAALEASSSYILRVTSGERAGDWFCLDVDSASRRTCEVADDGYAGSLSALEGDEAFAIHQLFTLRELFPEDGSLVPAGSIDVDATQLHFYAESGLEKIWLSDGTITEHSGWTAALGGELKYIGDRPIFPGSAFSVHHPGADEVVTVRLQGIALDAPLNIPFHRGSNFVSAAYSDLKQGQVSDVFSVKQLGICKSGFSGGDGGSYNDVVVFFDESDGSLGGVFYLDESTGEFLPNGDTSIKPIARPGSGFIVVNSGEPFAWSYTN